MNSIIKLFGIKYPIIQGGMVWVSGNKLVSQVSENGGLGVLGAGSMYPKVLAEHIIKCKKATDKPFGVNIPLMYPDIDELMAIIMEHKVAVVFTSAGSPNLWTAKLQAVGIKVVHVVSSVKFALKAQAAGVDAVVAEGFEAGGHNGREESTTMTLIPMVKKALDIPVLAAGGIATGRSMLAAMALGADGVQIGSRFVMSKESSAHINFKDYILNSTEGDTVLTIKELAPVRMMRNAFYKQIEELYSNNASAQQLKDLLGRGRAKKGMFLGDMTEGELEIGQVAGLIDSVMSVKDIMQEIVSEYNQAKTTMMDL
ncbi:MAG: nitronate monooxygenase [Flavobacteriaceae bacterium]|nr:nitronate monooxygenase [Flavobacteriaceae bacterium]